MKALLYYPSVTMDGKPIHDRNALMLQHVKEICTISGGATVDNQSAGFWNNAKGELVQESVNRITVFLSDTVQYNRFKALCQKIKIDLNQESFLIEKNGKAVFL